MIGKKVIIRIYSAGVWFGLFDQKQKNEVILMNADACGTGMLLKFSLSAAAVKGINQNKSKS